jgi:hypothetical protein
MSLAHEKYLELQRLRNAAPIALDSYHLWQCHDQRSDAYDLLAPVYRALYHLPKAWR